jgi:hypothetical protein
VNVSCFPLIPSITLPPFNINFGKPTEIWSGNLMQLRTVSEFDAALNSIFYKICFMFPLEKYQVDVGDISEDSNSELNATLGFPDSLDFILADLILRIELD